MRACMNTPDSPYGVQVRVCVANECLKCRDTAAFIVPITEAIESSLLYVPFSRRRQIYGMSRNGKTWSSGLLLSKLLLRWNQQVESSFRQKGSSEAGLVSAREAEEAVTRRGGRSEPLVCSFSAEDHAWWHGTAGQCLLKGQGGCCSPLCCL